VLKVYRDPNNPDVLRVAVYDNPEDEDPAVVMELNFADELGDEVEGVPGEWVELVDEA
jgi:hypothetical protein